MKRTFLFAAVFMILAIALAGCRLGEPDLDEDIDLFDLDEELAENETEDIDDLLSELDEDLDLESENATGNETVDDTDEEEVSYVEGGLELTTEESALPRKVVQEGDLVSFPNLKAVDPEGGVVEYTYSEPLDEDGEWQTGSGDKGKYIVIITADDGKNQVQQQVLIVVQERNAAPVLTVPESVIRIEEGETVSLDVVAEDPDGEPVTITYTGWMNSPTKVAEADDIGEHKVTVSATDGISIVQKTVTILVEDINHAPVFEPMTDVITFDEGDTVELNLTVADPDGDNVTVTYSRPLDRDGMWETRVGDAGSYKVNITASDGDLETTVEALIVIESSNKAPVITLASDTIRVEEGETVVLNYEVIDPEDDRVTVTISGWMHSDTYTTEYDDEGIHTVTIEASDNVNTAAAEVTVIVADINRPPTFAEGSFE